MRRLLLFAACFAAPAVVAQEGSYLVAFEAGRYQEAAEIAAASPTSDDLALAARALLAEAMSGDTQPEPALLAEAEDFARQALDMNPDHLEGRLQLAIALSLKMRPMSTRDARRTGEANAPRDLAAGVLADDPDNAYAHGLLAIWNIEVVRRGGPIGSAIMGASVRQARRHYADAVAAKPGDAAIHWQYARALAALDARKYGEDIDAALAAAAAAPLDDALEATMAKRCETLKAALAKGDPNAVETLASDML